MFGENYIFVLKSFRQSVPKNNGYLSLTEFFQKMEEEHGLEYDPLYPLKNPSDDVYSFRVINNGKAFTFAMTYSEFVKKP